MDKESREQLWNKVWDDAGYYTLKKKIEEILESETTSIFYPPLEILDRLNLRYKSVLDVGCGSGSFSIALKKAQKVSVAYLVDFSSSALYLAKRLREDFFGREKDELIQCDARALPFRENSFCLAFSTGMIEHFDTKTQGTIIKECCRVANDVICQVPTSSIPYWIMRFFISIFNRGWPFGCEKPLNISELRQLFAKENYVIRCVSGYVGHSTHFIR